MSYYGTRPFLDTDLKIITIMIMNILNKIVLALLVLLLLTGCLNSAVSEGYKDLSAAGFNEMIQKGNALILDVRTPVEYQQGHIKDSVLIPVQTLDKEYTKILEHKEKNILVYCRSGNRSVTASNILIKQGFKKVYNMKGGIKDWVKEKFPIETSN